MGFNLAFEKEKVKKCYLFEGFWMLWKWQACFSYLSISSDWPDQITWDLKFKLFMFFPTLDSNRKPICNANLEIFWKNIILRFLKYICSLVLHFFPGKKSRYQKIMLYLMFVSEAILVRPVVRKSAWNTIQLCSLWWGELIPLLEHNMIAWQDPIRLSEHNWIMWRHTIGLCPTFETPNRT